MTDTPQQLIDRIDIRSVVGSLKSLPDVLREAMDEADQARHALKFAEDDLKECESNAEVEVYIDMPNREGDTVKMTADHKKVIIKNYVLKHIYVKAAKRKVHDREFIYSQADSRVSRIKRNMLSLQCLCGLSESLCNLQASMNQTTIVINKTGKET